MSDQPDPVDVVLAGVLRELASLRDKVAALEGTGQQLQMRGLSVDPEPPLQTVPQRIDCNADPDEVADWHLSLQAWVPWCVETFHLQERIAPCWQQHPQLVEEFTGLWLCWRDAWLTPPTPWAPTRFHAELAAAMNRIHSAWPTSCTTARHDPHPSPKWQQEATRPTYRPWQPS